MQSSKSFQLWLLLLAVHCALALPRLSANGDSHRIVGGQTAAPHQFPYQVSIRHAANNQHFCGGSIIRRNFILTAAHCLVIREAELIVFVAGAHFLTELPAVYEVAEIIMHPHYNGSNAYNDIALLRSRNDIVFSATVHPISLGGGPYIGAGLWARTSGWGNQFQCFFLCPAEELQFLDVVTLTIEDCRARHGDVMQHYITDSVLCAYSNEYGKGICGGDSGGGLEHNGTLIGIVSFTEPCGLGRPDGFTRVSLFYSWIIGIVDG